MFMAENATKSDRLVTVFGGSGFVGRHVVRALAKAGWRVRVAARRPDLAFFLQPSGKVGQIHAVQANIRYPASIAAAVKGASAVINLVGILAPSGTQSFEALQHLGAAAVAKAAAEAGAQFFVQVSAIGADAAGNSLYAQTKAKGESAVLEAFPRAAILRPSVVFGPEDDFFNRFAKMAQLLPALPLIGGGKTKLQPVFVDDVAEAVMRCLSEPACGKIYELGGPEIVTMREIMAYVLSVTGRKRLLAPLPFSIAKWVGLGSEIGMKLSLGLLPPSLAVTRDQVELLRQDNIVSPEAIAEGRTLSGLGIAPCSFETIAPTYLYRFRKTGQFAGTRAA
jgi:NADH dehydrogenase